MTGSDAIDWVVLEPQYRLAYEAAQARLAAQEASFEAIRGRAVQLITVAGAVSAFIGGIKIKDAGDGIGWLTVAALALFGATLAVGLWTLRSTDWRSRPDASQVIDRYIERIDGPASMAEMYRGLSVDMEKAEGDNQPVLVDRFTTLEWETWLTAAVLVAWLLELAVF